MNASDFHEKTDAIFDQIVLQIDDREDDLLEAELQNDSVSITTHDNLCCLITKNTVLKEIWVSSPVHGAAHFSYDTQKSDWLSTRDKAIDLSSFLSKELSLMIGLSLVIHL